MCTHEFQQALGGKLGAAAIDVEITHFLKSATLGSFRVTAPDIAYQAGIGKERRRHLGHWVEDGAVDTYTYPPLKRNCRLE